MIKNNKKLIIGFILGAIMFTSLGVCAATILSSREITYDNINSKLSSTNVQDAIDELYNKSKLKNRKNIVEAYTYNQTSGASDYCVTGDEETCKETTCYKNATVGSCPAGTIIVYKVNDTEIVRFHVIHDKGSTMTMQSQRNIIYNLAWIDYDDYKSENTDGTSCSHESATCSDEGPITILEALEGTTTGWDNINKQTYTMGTTTFKTNAYTGCSTHNSCTTNVYTLPSKTVRARMLTVQEAADLGCTSEQKSCPKWMYNYMTNSTDYNGTTNDANIGPNVINNSAGNDGYWMMNVYSGTNVGAWRIIYNGSLNYSNNNHNNYYGARAVVEINK